MIILFLQLSGWFAHDFRLNNFDISKFDNTILEGLVPLQRDTGWLLVLIPWGGIVFGMRDKVHINCFTTSSPLNNFVRGEAIFKWVKHTKL